MASSATPNVLIRHGGEHISIEMEELIANSITKKLGHSATHLRSDGICCIHRVPDKFHKMTEPSAYIPEVLSIGPYHRGKESLKAMEDQKLSYMHTLLDRKAKMKFGEEEEAVVVRAKKEKDEEEEQRVLEEKQREGEEVVRRRQVQGRDVEDIIKEGEIEDVITTARIIQSESPGLTSAPSGWVIILKDCIEAIKKMETEIRECYSDPIELASEEFIEMIVVDGLFIIEHLRRLHMKINNIGTGRHAVDLYWDILLVENQLPIFVLEHLFILTVEENKAGTDAFYQLVLSYFRLSFLSESFTSSVDFQLYKDAKHLLDLLTKALQPRILSNHNAGKVIPIPGAMELSRAGVQFKKRFSVDHHNILDIKFNSDGTFEIPPLIIDDFTERGLRNLVASEQFSKCSTHITSYSILMDRLINSAEDVNLLRNQGILTIQLGSDEQVADMFNQRCACAHFIRFSFNYYQLSNEVNKYYKKRQHRWKATLKREYFNNPWSIISFIAAVLLILLTIISTMFTTLAWIVPKS